MKKIIIFTLLISNILILGSCWNSTSVQTTSIPTKTIERPSIPASQIKISIKNFTFDPADITIKAWTTVTWTNEDSAPHTTTSDGRFDSKSLSQWQSFSYTFDKTGNFDYICTFHPHMKGKIIVN